MPPKQPAPKSKKPAAGRKSAADDRTHPKLWRTIQQKWLKGSKGGVAGKWNARKAQLAVQEYKRKSQEKYGDSGYKTPKTKAKMRDNSLNKWTQEDWGYIDGKKGNRYLPKTVRDKLTPSEKRRENSKKKNKLGEWVPYSDSVRGKMKKAGVF